MTTVHRLKITLVGTRPLVWRRLLVSSDATLGELHLVIQAAFGWWCSHLHEFEIGRERYSDDDESEARDELGVTLVDVAPVGAKFSYTYDFGDDWRHRIEVEAIEPADANSTYPACVDGRRAGPPEDCGGPSGYADLLAVLGDPAHPGHEEMIEWVGSGFDAEHFDPTEFGKAYEAGPPMADFF